MDITDDISRLDKKYESCPQPENGEVRLFKWYFDKLFRNLLDFTVQRNVDIIQQSSLYEEDEEYVPWTRGAVLLIKEFEEYILEKRDINMWCTSENPCYDVDQFDLFICSEVEVKKLRKATNNKWYICKYDRSHQSPSRVSADEENKDTLPAEVIALLWEENGRYYIIFDPEFITNYMQPMTRGGRIHSILADSWESASTHEVEDYLSLERLKNELQKRERFGPNFELSPKMMKAIAPFDVISRHFFYDIVENLRLNPPQTTENEQESDEESLIPLQYRDDFSSFFGN